MVFYKIITICVLSFNYVESVPTFGDEFVHIKVHVPKEPSSSRGILAPKHPGSPQLIIAPPKVIHHFHRRRKPFKKVPKLETAPLFENILLEELDKPHDEYSDLNEAKHVEPIEETFIVKEEHVAAKPITKVNTYAVIEETLHKPLHYDQSQQHYHHSQQDYGKENIETFKIIEEHEERPLNYHHHHHHQNYEPKHVKQHVETFKLIEEKPHYNYQQHVADYNYHQPQEEIIKVIKTPKYKTPFKDYSHYQEPQPEKDEHYHHHTQQHVAKDHYDYHQPHQETIAIVKTKPVNAKGYSKPYQESNYKNYHSQNYHPEPIKETIEIIKTKNTPKYHYDTDSEYNYESKHHYDYQQPQEEIIKIEETKYSTPKEKYHHQEIPEKNYHYNREPETIVEEHVYKKPLNNNHYSQQSQKEYGKSSYPTSYETQSQHYIPPTSSPAESYLQYKPSSSYTQYNERPKYNDDYNERPKYAAGYNESPKYDDSYGKYNTIDVDVEQHLPSTETAPEFHSTNNYQPASSSAVRQNTLYDELEPSNVDWPGTAGHKATETYTGYDSYSAGHVQGVGSGGYKYHLPYP